MEAEDLGIESVEDVLVTYGIDGKVRKTKRGMEMEFICIFHPDTNPSASVNLSTGLFKCWSCGVAGDMLKLGTKALGVSYEEVRSMFEPDSTGSARARVLRKTRAISRPKKESAVRQTEVSMPELGSWDDGPLDDLTDRGFDLDVLRHWDIRFCPSETMTKADGESFQIKNTIAIPVITKSGGIAGWMHRRTDDSFRWQPKYINTAGAVFEEVWFGEYQTQNADSVVVVEGALDAIWVNQNGYPAIGAGGTSVGITSDSMNPKKKETLCSYRSVILFPDKDMAGLQFAQNVAKHISKIVPVSVARYPNTGLKKPDPQDLAPVDVELAIERAIPLAAWRQRLQR